MENKNFSIPQELDTDKNILFTIFETDKEKQGHINMEFQYKDDSKTNICCDLLFVIDNNITTQWSNISYKQIDDIVQERYSSNKSNITAELLSYTLDSINHCDILFIHNSVFYHIRVFSPNDIGNDFTLAKEIVDGLN